MHFGPQKTSFDQIKLLKNLKIMLENRFLSAKMHFYYERLFFWGPGSGHVNRPNSHLYKGPLSR